MRTPAVGRSRAHQFSWGARGPANSLSPIPESGARATDRSAVPPEESLAVGQVALSPFFPSRLPPEPSTRSDLTDEGRRMRSPGATVKRGWAAHDQGTG